MEFTYHISMTLFALDIVINLLFFRQGLFPNILQISCFDLNNNINCRWQKEEQQNVFSIDWRGELDDQNHLITSILAYPINGGSNYLDWTCILIGLSSGSILFYSDTGSQLHQQSLHTQPVYSIKACYNEEIYVSFNDCVITVPTLYLVPILKNLKESINKPKLNIEEYLLNFKKWEFKNKDLLLNDSVLNTQQSICAFDHLLGERFDLYFTLQLIIK